MELILDYLFYQINGTAQLILPSQQAKNLPKLEDFERHLAALYDPVFVCEKYLAARILPIQWEIIQSSQFNEKDTSFKENLTRLKVLLTKGNNIINSNDTGYLPKSRQKYLRAEYGKNERRYVNDSSQAFFGIKHLHLDTTKNVDELLFYVTHKNKFYFLFIGKHNDIYTDRGVRIIIEEFNYLIPDVGFTSLSDMPAPKSLPYTQQWVTDQWLKGSNVSFVIDGQYYTGTNGQTTGRLPTSIIYQTANIFYQMELQLKAFNATIKDMVPGFNGTVNYVVDEQKSKTALKDGIVYVIETHNKIELAMKVNYLKRVGYIQSIFQNNS